MNYDHKNACIRQTHDDDDDDDDDDDSLLKKDSATCR